MEHEDYPRNFLAFERRFSSEDACRKYLWKLRWPAEIHCPRCSGEVFWPMGNGRLFCQACSYQLSATVGTIFQDTKLPLTTWFRAMWHMTSHKNGVSALGLQRDLGLGSYKTAWSLLHKLRRAMVRPMRERLNGVVEVDETYWGSKETGGATGRLVYSKALIAIAAEVDGRGIGRIRMARIPDFARSTLHGFVQSTIEPGSTVCTDGLNSYRQLENYLHERRVQRTQPDGEHLLPRVHRVVSLFKRWLLGTHQGAISQEHLDDYLNEFTFRFNRRKSASRGKLFFRLAQQAVLIEPVPYANLIDH